jgi:CO dehydrogenase/acetyl-CoA synthase epsilon subunit
MTTKDMANVVECVLNDSLRSMRIMINTATESTSNVVSARLEMMIKEAYETGFIEGQKALKEKLLDKIAELESSKLRHGVLEDAVSINDVAYLIDTTTVEVEDKC